MPNNPARQDMANAIRALSMDAVEAAKSGHPGMPMGMADAATALFADHLKFDAGAPDWPDRDRFVLESPTWDGDKQESAPRPTDGERHGAYH